MTWSRESLHQFVQEALCDHKLIVVSNREPYIHRRTSQGVQCLQPASGMAAALDPILRSCGGTWVAHGSGDADRDYVNLKGRLRVPPEAPAYMLRRVWLTAEQEEGYYYGAANQALWPLCHNVFKPPVFNPADWEQYRRVNQIFAEAVLDEAAGGAAFVFIQDYHFGLLPRLLRKQNPNLIVAQFWHIPWPNREALRAFPWKEELLDGMLGNDLLGFHLPGDCRNFLKAVDRGIEAKVDPDRSTVVRGGSTTAVRPFPISTDFDAYSSGAAGSRVEAEMENSRRHLGLANKLVGLGIDRIDYTKGIPERLRAIDSLLEQCPQYRRRLVFVQVGVPSRGRIAEYRRLDEEIQALAMQINAKWIQGAWQPILFLRGHLGPVQLMALHRLADFCMITALHDGMNLVAKEFVSSRFDEDGVLILSEFTGAARELRDAVLVNPFDVRQCASAIARALEMPALERRLRMQRMRRVVAKHNVYRWAAKLISELVELHAIEEAVRIEEAQPACAAR
jgi:trehalose 6-phosphate synthase